ncbi:BnaA03g55160D [Brassica napus]|uniref:BnaA03g55160D protein n=2 Tax=Brassica napus TaxID=3708 RepID=A0A078IQF4_BRANA|nr:BnaA03g55160D [Brassica napus]
MDPVDMLSSESSYGNDVSDDGIATELMEQATYKCKYCPKTYSKGQALGGHQNVHKREREITKRQERAMLVNMNPPDPYPYPHPFPSQYALPSGFEQRRYIIDEPDILHVVYNSSQSPYQLIRHGSTPHSIIIASIVTHLLKSLSREMDAEKEDHDLSLYLSLKL